MELWQLAANGGYEDCSQWQLSDKHNIASESRRTHAQVHHNINEKRSTLYPMLSCKVVRLSAAFFALIHDGGSTIVRLHFICLHPSGILERPIFEI